jgi:NAD(P)-dependent dehydrogenase (short-subunit alcohol dehydrogenase family)
MILKNKIIIVAGGQGLIGAAIVKDIKNKGGIVINSDIALDTFIENNTFHLNIADTKSIDACVQFALNNHGRIDGLVNCAYPRTKDWGDFFEDVKMDSWRQNVDMQMNSVFYFCQQVLKIMRQQCSGAVVNIGSTYGVVASDFSIYEGLGMTSAAGYSAIKGGIIHFTRYLASFYGKYNIRVNCVSPGGIFDNQNPVFVERYKARVPMRRMGNPDDIAPAVSFLLSEEAKYVTGHNLMVDGGWTII